MNKGDGIEIFTKKSNIVHFYKYDYSLVEYINNKTKVKIICKEHGIFEQVPVYHTTGSICPICNNFKKSKKNEEFINDCIIKHHNRYDYSLVNYINSRTKINIICEKHGLFTQNSRSHLNGKGCPKCKLSKGELFITNYLLVNNIYFIAQKNLIGKLRFDFYLPKHNTCIEFNGRQHYESVSIYGGQIGLKKQIKNDNIKVEYCRKNNIQLIIIKYDESIEDRLSILLDNHHYQVQD